MGKHFWGSVTALLFNCLLGVLVCSVLGCNAAYGMGAGAASVALGSFMPGAGCLCAGVYTEVWTGELVKALKKGMMASFLNGLPDYSSKVNNDVIHMVDVGGDPDVLVNNTTYPLAVQHLDDGDIAIGLDKYQTKATKVTDDELHAISYDKFGSDVERHGDAITITKFKKAAHALAPDKNTKTTPVLATTGENDPIDGRKKMCPADVLAMKRSMDKLNVPAEGRRLVLCQDHVNDLLSTDQKFKEQYNLNMTDGKIGRLYGFDIYEFENCPLYTSAGVKKAWDATASNGEFQASFAFYAKRTFKADGSTTMYYSEAKTDPLNQQSLVNFRHYYVVLPKKKDAFVAMYSAKVTTVEG